MSNWHRDINWELEQVLARIRRYQWCLVALGLLLAAAWAACMTYMAYLEAKSWLM